MQKIDNMPVQRFIFKTWWNFCSMRRIRSKCDDSVWRCNECQFKGSGDHLEINKLLIIFRISLYLYGRKIIIFEVEVQASSQLHACFAKFEPPSLNVFLDSWDILDFFKPTLYFLIWGHSSSTWHLAKFRPPPMWHLVTQERTGPPFP